MIVVESTIEALRKDQVLAREQEIQFALQKSSKENCSTLSAWLYPVLNEARDHFATRTMARAFVSYAVNQFWELNKTVSSSEAKDQILDFAFKIKDVPFYDMPTAPELTNLSSAISVSAEMLFFLQNRYEPVLRENFSDAFLVGSLNYGPFYSIKGPEHSDKSDIDLFLVPKFELDPTQLGVANPDLNIVDIDSRDRITKFNKEWDRAAPEFLNYRLYDVDRKIEISVNIGSLAGLQKALSFRSVEQEICKLYRTKSMGGTPSILPDLGSAPFCEPYTETSLEDGFLLEIPRFTLDGTLRRYCGFAAMFTPKINALFTTNDGEHAMAAFKGDITTQIAEYRLQGRDANISNGHVRQARFSPLARRLYNAEYI